ncbi:hypothetical protein [Nocardia cyriacigeorgica]|uniref:hypothetical protein n=1 Tax=Nocardia cyriacigeorgica TaxID=135487 RepID=UPI0024556003|nr:hypothetical protein [Nocardia cyriacigeorgica]
MRQQPTALGWIDAELTRAPEWDAARIRQLARRLGYLLEWHREGSVLPLVDQVREAEADALIIPAPDHLDPITLNAVMHYGDVESVNPRLSFARWSIIGAQG